MITIKTENYNLISQDFYNKTIASLDLNLIPCACGHTHALLLSSIVPYSQIPLDVQVAAVKAYEYGSSLSPVLSGQCFVDESNLRSVIRSYRLHWKERLYSAGLSFSEGASLVSGCFFYFSRQFMQIKTTVNKLFLSPT